MGAHDAGTGYSWPRVVPRRTTMAPPFLCGTPKKNGTQSSLCKGAETLNPEEAHEVRPAVGEGFHRASEAVAESRAPSVDNAHAEHPAAGTAGEYPQPLIEVQRCQLGPPAPRLQRPRRSDGQGRRGSGAPFSRECGGGN